MKDRFHLLRLVPGTSLLPIPFAMVFASLALFALTISIDYAVHIGWLSLPRWLSVGGAEDARAILGAIITSVSTVLALIFSISLLVFSQTVSWYGPRLMYRFLRDRTMQGTLGLFLATFVYSLLANVIVRQQEGLTYVPQITIIASVALVLVSFAFLVIYNHRVAVALQTSNVLAQIVDDLHKAIALLWGEGVITGGDAASTLGQQNADEIREQCVAHGAALRATVSGYIQRIDKDHLLDSAARADAVVCLAFRPGLFVVEGEVLAYIWPSKKLEDLALVVLDGVKVGQQRTLEQDLEFAIFQLVEVALRALSSAVNDLHTALTCIDWMGDALRVLAALPVHEGAWRDADGAIRLVSLHRLRFDRMVKSAFDQIRQAGVDSAAVTIRLLQTYERLAPFLKNEERRRAVADQNETTWQAASRHPFPEGDRIDMEAAYQKAHRALAS